MGLFGLLLLLILFRVLKARKEVIRPIRHLPLGDFTIGNSTSSELFVLVSLLDGVLELARAGSMRILLVLAIAGLCGRQAETVRVGKLLREALVSL